MSQETLAHLSRADAVLGGLIRAVGPCEPDAPEDCHPFQVLAQAIAHQQLNGTAANTILKRLIDSCGRGTFPTPHQVLQASVTGLQPRQPYVLALAHLPNGGGALEPLAAFMTNPAGSAIVNATGPIRQVVQGEDKIEHRYLVIAQGSPAKPAE